MSEEKRQTKRMRARLTIIGEELDLGDPHGMSFCAVTAFLRSERAAATRGTGARCNLCQHIPRWFGDQTFRPQAARR